jgi:small neutral amino acid transporter SnatA (MarC family)
VDWVTKAENTVWLFPTGSKSLIEARFVPGCIPLIVGSGVISVAMFTTLRMGTSRRSIMIAIAIPITIAIGICPLMTGGKPLIETSVIASNIPLVVGSGVISVVLASLGTGTSRRSIMIAIAIPITIAIGICSWGWLYSGSRSTQSSTCKEHEYTEQHRSKQNNA